MMSVAILLQPDPDLPVLPLTADVPKTYGIAHARKITSAHPAPGATQTCVRKAEARGCKVLIASAADKGRAGVSPEVVAGRTLRGA